MSPPAQPERGISGEVNIRTFELVIRPSIVIIVSHQALQVHVKAGCCRQTPLQHGGRYSEPRVRCQLVKMIS